MQLKTTLRAAWQFLHKHGSKYKCGVPTAANSSLGNVVSRILYRAMPPAGWKRKPSEKQAKYGVEILRLAEEGMSIDPVI